MELWIKSNRPDLSLADEDPDSQLLFKTERLRAELNDAVMYIVKC
jgi:hypothetical protein